MFRSFRPALLFLATTIVALPSASAQSSADRAQEKRERDAERAQERAERDAERQRQKDERNRAGALDTTVTFDARGTVSVTCPGGAVIVTAGTRNEIKVHARTESGAIRFTSSGSRATLEPSLGRGCSDGQFDVTVPVGVKVVATTWSGSIRVRGVRGDVEVHSQSGDVDVRDAVRLDVETLSGDVIAANVSGETNMHSVSGGLRLTGGRGDVVVETVSGDLDLSDIIAKQVRTHSTSGDVSYTGQIQDGGRYEFVTHSGEIVLNVPGSIGAELSISTFNGGIESDFPITLKAGQHGIGSSQAKHLNFTVGHGTARISAETFSGDITLKRH